MRVRGWSTPTRSWSGSLRCLVVRLLLLQRDWWWGLLINGELGLRFSSSSYRNSIDWGGGVGWVGLHLLLLAWTRVARVGALLNRYPHNGLARALAVLGKWRLCFLG